MCIHCMHCVYHQYMQEQKTKHKVGHDVKLLLHYVSFNNKGAEVKVYYFLMREWCTNLCSCLLLIQGYLKILFITLYICFTFHIEHASLAIFCYLDQTFCFQTISFVMRWFATLRLSLGETLATVNSGEIWCETEMFIQTVRWCG